MNSAQNESNCKSLKKIHVIRSLILFFQIEAVSKAIDDYTACMNYVNIKESEKVEQTRKFISDYGGWNISNSGWSSKNWTLLSNLIKIHRDLQIFPFFFVDVIEDIKNSSRHQLVVSSFLNDVYVFHLVGRGDDKRLRYVGYKDWGVELNDNNEGS